jgi:hypothetical protein
MGRFTRLVNGVLKSFDEASPAPIYDESLIVVESSPQSGQILPLDAGDPLTLPNSQTYEGLELQIFHNGQYLEDVADYILTSSTQITFTFDLEIGDKVRFRIDRLPE